MKAFSVLRVVALLACVLPQVVGPATAQTSQGPAHFVFVLSSGAMPTAGAGLHLAIMAAQTGRSVDVVLLASALDLGRDGATGPEFPTYAASGPAMLVQAMQAGARVSTCRTCLLNQGLDIGEMIDGIARINALNFLDMTQAADVVLSFGAPDAGTGISFGAAATLAPAATTEPACDPLTDKDACM